MPIPFYLYKSDNHIYYSAKHVFELEDRLFLIESNKDVVKEDVVKEDVVPADDFHYDIVNNDFYVMIVLNKKTLDISASYGYFRYCHSLYYYIADNSIYVNLSLRNLIDDIKVQLSLDLDNASKFVKNGFVRKSNTLIEQIKKVPPLQTAIFSNNSVKFIDSRYIDRSPLSDFVENLKISLPSKDNKIILPLSGGFDSTLLAYLMRDYDVSAFTVGVKENFGELTNANRTAKFLHFDHHKVFSNKQWIQSFPDIVNTMEGEMFDIGVFLCYFLVNEIKNANIHNGTVVTGDGADQILNKNFYTENLSFNPVGFRLDDAFLDNYPKHFFYYLIANKIEWLLRVNDIKYVMPYASKEFSNYAKTAISTLRKVEYKEFVKSYVPSEISSQLSKKGGLINESFFINKDIANHLSIMLNNAKYEGISKLGINSLRCFIYKVYLMLFSDLFIDNKSLSEISDKFACLS